MADFKTIGIYGWYDVGSTIKPTVMEAKYFDGGSLVTSPISTTTVFQVQMRFSKAMDKSITPMVWFDSSGAADPTVPAGAGTWYDIIESGDTWRTPQIALDGTHIGAVTVKASGGTSSDGNVMDANNAVDTFTLQNTTIISASRCYFTSQRRFSNESGQAVTLGATGATQMFLSGDVREQTFRGTQAYAWITYSASGDVVLTSGDGVKKIYANFRNASGDTTGWGGGDPMWYDTSGDNIAWIRASQPSGGTEIPDSTWQILNKPFIFWSEPSGGVAPIRGYSFLITSGDGVQTPDNVLDGFSSHVDFTNYPVKPGKWKFLIRTQDEAGNFGNTMTFNLWIASGDSQTTVSEIRGYTSPAKTTEIPSGTVTWSGDSSIYLEWNDPLSPGDDTFYIQHSGDTVNSRNFALSSGGNTWWSPQLNSGNAAVVKRILVRSITGLGVSGDISQYLFCWASGTVADFVP